MELTMTNNFGFCELNENEMMMVDGGKSPGLIVGSIVVAAIVGVGVWAAAPLFVTGAAISIASGSTGAALAVGASISGGLFGIGISDI